MKIKKNHIYFQNNLNVLIIHVIQQFFRIHH